MHRGASWFLTLAVGTGLSAQAPRLVDRIEAPLLYMCLDAAAVAVAAEGPGAGAGPVQSLLADPAFDTLFGDHGALADGSAGRALALVRGVLARSAGDLELALTGVLPSGGQPLLVLRARLRVGEGARLLGRLDGPDLARAHREVAGHRTWVMGGAATQTPGEVVELSLIGDDLLVANDATAMEELLQPVGTTLASGGRRVLASDPCFTTLKQKLDVAPGSLLVYGDWRRLGQRLQGDGSGSFPIEWRDFAGARSVMAAVAGGALGNLAGSFTGTLLIDFDTPPAVDGPRAPAGEPRPGRPERGGRGERRSPGESRPGDFPGRPPHGHGGSEPFGIEHWLRAARPTAARQLLAQLPNGGLGGLVVSVDLADLVARSHQGGQMLHAVQHAFEEYGLDFERNVRSRLGATGTVQLLFREAKGGDAAGVVPAYSVRAKSRKAAADLFSDLRRSAEQHKLGRLLEGREARGFEILELTSERHAGATYLMVADETLVVAFDTDALAQVHEEWKRAAKQRGKRDSQVTAALAAIGGEQVTGLFDLDLAPWFERFARVLAPAGGAGGPDLSRLPKRHTGYLDLQPRDGGIVVRVCVLSSS